MTKHLFLDDNHLTTSRRQLEWVSSKEYWKRRIQFWVWKKHRTMGNPILMRRR